MYLLFVYICLSVCSSACFVNRLIIMLRVIKFVLFSWYIPVKVKCSAYKFADQSLHIFVLTYGLDS